MRATRYDRYRRAQNADHFAHNSPFSAFFAEVVCTLGMTPPRTVISPPPKGVCTTSMEGTARSAGPGYGTHGLQCPWAGRSLAGLVTATQAPPVRRVPEGQAAGPVGGGRAWPGFETTHPATHSDTSAAGVEGAGGHGGHGRASRSTTPSRRLACGDLAGGRARRHPEHQRRPEHHQHPAARTLRRMPTRHSGITKPPGPIGAGRQWR